MKVLSDRNGGWSLIDAPEGTKLSRLTISFPSTKSDTGKGTTYSIASSAKVSIEIIPIENTWHIQLTY